MVLGHEGESRSRYPEFSISELDVELDGDASIYQRIIDFLALLGHGPEQLEHLLYRGCERTDIDTHGTFVHERYDITSPGAIWAFTDAEFRYSAEQGIYARGGTESPLYYALKSTEQPALVVLDGSALEPVPDSLYQYVPVEGSTLEDSIVAVVSITH